MKESADSKYPDISLATSTMEKWEKTTNLISDLFELPHVLVMRVLSDEFEVFVCSSYSKDIFSIGQRFPIGAGYYYCDKVINSRQIYAITNASKHDEWKNAPSSAKGLISYLGIPILWPDGEVFGVLCALDNKERVFDKKARDMMSLSASIFSDSLQAFMDREKLAIKTEQQFNTNVALAESEDRFKKVFDLSPTAIMITAKSDGRFIDVNDACLKLFGVEKQELLGRKVTEFPMYGDPSERDFIIEIIQNEHRLRRHISHKKHSSGADLELEVSVDVININDEPCLIATLYDLTEKNKLERQLRDVNERLTLATDAGGIGVWDWDIVKDKYQWNDHMHRLYGTDTDSASVKTWLSLMHPDDKQRFEKDFEESLTKGTSLSSQFRIRKADGQTRIVQSYGRVITDISGKPVRMLGVNIDLTDKTDAQSKLEANEIRLSRAQKLALVGNWEYDQQNQMFWASEVGMSIYGFTSGSYASTDTIASATYPEDKPMMEAAMRSVLSGGGYNVRFRIRRLDNGETRVLHSVAELDTHPNDGRKIVKGVVQDITDYECIEQKLVDSERRYKALFENTSAVQMLVEMETGIIVAANSAAFSYYGYSSAELIGQSMVLINGLSNETMLERYNKAYYRVVNYYEVQHKLKSGEQRWVATFSGPLDINDKKYVSLIVNDITDRIIVEDNLRANEARYRSLFNRNAAVQIIIDSETGVLLDANNAACIFYGLTIDDIRNKSIWDLNASSCDEVQSMMDKALGSGTVHMFTKHLRGDKEIRDVEVFCVCIEPAGKKLFHAIVHDITERMLAESALAESERRFRLFIESAPDGVFVETGGRFAYVNKKTVSMFGYERESDMIQLDVLSHFTEEHRETIKRRMHALRILKVAVPLRDEAIITLDGSRLDVEVSAVPFRYQDEDGALVFIRDISQRKQMEKERDIMEAQLQQKQKLEAIGTLAGGVAHEINNPVTGIINYAQLIAEAQSADDEVKKFCAEIIYEGNRIAEIVSSLLKFSRHEKKSHSPAQISDIVSGTLSLTRTILRHDHITLQVNIPEGLPSIKCRSQQLQQVLMNLITNARDALNARYEGYHEDKIIHIYTSMFMRDGRRWLRLIVEDKGTGISSDLMDRIFDPFFTTKPRDAGTGLGLSISHGIVREHHGELYFESIVGEYTKAIVELPIDNGWHIE